MKPAKDGNWRDVSEPLNETEGGRIFVQRPACLDLVVIIGIPLRNLPSVSLAEDHKMIETLALDQTDQPFCEAILPG